MGSTSINSTTYALAIDAFSSYDNDTRVQLYYILITFETATHPAVIFNIFMPIIGVVTTVFDLLILFRKSMLKSSVISIMIGMASCDFIAMLCSLPFTTLPFHFYWFRKVTLVPFGFYAVLGNESPFLPPRTQRGNTPPPAPVELAPRSSSRVSPPTTEEPAASLSRKTIITEARERYEDDEDKTVKNPEPKPSATDAIRMKKMEKEKKSRMMK
ncbi:hypothetical protein CAEBREN_04835 [Caenorhabditis brenneri]|uniref:G-protein coupled receptors family 1 profile domain-containing protein n=1 Tax=Caenorhabditis brenneri TaxID=135651 RepID=G0NGJ4_CAEBE|nr:hypothetical protein CAEBREN_04835 [Caenorhabditis brenneri]